MKSKSHNVFFPGKGVYSLPEGREISSAYTAGEARALFVAKELLAQPEVGEHDSLHFSEIHSVGTRSSSNEKPIDWNEVESILKDRGFLLKKRSYLDGAFDDMCPVFFIEHPEFGVIAEGKGLDEMQARRSALAEAIERVFGNEPNSIAKQSVCTGTYQNLYENREWDLGRLTGPRDLFDTQISTEWIPARNISRDESCAIPAEMAYFEYIPDSTNTRLFSLHHTMGLAAGSSIEDAALSGIFEVIERDAYWITMRCRINCPDIDIQRIQDIDPKISIIISRLQSLGFDLIVKDMSLDWGVPVVHAILKDTKGRIPAFSHGTGASFSWATAAARAVCEVLQMYSGLNALLNEHFLWEEVVSVTGVLGKPELAWSDPLYEIHLKHLLEHSTKTWEPKESIQTVAELLNRLSALGHEVIVADLKADGPLKVVRVHITDATQPDPRLERISKRLEVWAEREGLEKGFYADAILT